MEIYTETGFATDYTYNSRGLLATESQSGGNTTLYQYDALRRPTTQIGIATEGLTGEYRDQYGELLHRRIDANLNFSASEDFAGYDDLPTGFSANWTGAIYIEIPGEITFYLDSSDYGSVKIDGQLVVESLSWTVSVL
jgi:YD repeat-containing protein